MTELIPAPVHDGRRLDWFPRFDEASRDYPITAAADRMPERGRLWAPGRNVLDQGREGACCGFAAAAEAMAAPVPVPRVGNAYARGWYLNAKRRDQWPGEAYDGTSVLATMAEGQARGLYAGGYRWGFTAEQVAGGIAAPEDEDGGPAVVGVEWRDGNYTADALGAVRPAGRVVGGHALCLPGVVVPADLASQDEEGRDLRNLLAELQLLAAVRQLLEDEAEDAAYVGVNSWGLTFGMRGLFVLAATAMRGWVRARGEFAQPVGRRLPTRKGLAAMASDMQYDEEEPQPAGDATLHISAAEVQEGDRILDPPDELQQESVTVRGAPRQTRGWRGNRVVVDTTAGTFQLGAADPVTVRRAST